MSQPLLVLSCCAPCSCAIIEKLSREKPGQAVVLFYNPNIYPQTEHDKRRDENRVVCGSFRVPFLSLPYEHERWREEVQGLEDEPERGKRCERCFHMRLKRAMEYAKQGGFGAVSCVLGVSRHKNPAQVSAAAAEASEETGVLYLPFEGRKGGMTERRLALSKELGLYRQNYCGCEFSRDMSQEPAPAGKTFP